jgi:hypothetical protein
MRRKNVRISVKSSQICGTSGKNTLKIWSWVTPKCGIYFVSSGIFRFYICVYKLTLCNPNRSVIQKNVTCNCNLKTGACCNIRGSSASLTFLLMSSWVLSILSRTWGFVIINGVWIRYRIYWPLYTPLGTTNNYNAIIKLHTLQIITY